jgi:organic radical activating enzyme
MEGKMIKSTIRKITMNKRFLKNCCDGLYNSFDVHFTSACDNNCAHCIDMRFAGEGAPVKPDPKAIAKTLINNAEGFEDVLFLGGEPCLYLDELIEVIGHVQTCTKLKVFVTTAVPKTCYDEPEKFQKLLRMVDGMNLSVQHHIESIADTIRQTRSRFDRQAFYRALPFKEKIRINLNLVRPWLSDRLTILKCLRHYDEMGFNSIKVSEIQHGAEFYVSFKELFELELDSPYYHGCQTFLPYSEFPYLKTPVLLKRSCFLCEDTLQASFMDGVKAVHHLCSKPKNKYAVVYGNGTLSKGWK